MARYDELMEMIATPTDECILWPYARSSRGYGKVSVNGTVRPTHRLALETVSDPPTLKHHPAHGPCHNRLCVNPRHLSWKTVTATEVDLTTRSAGWSETTCDACGGSGKVQEFVTHLLIRCLRCDGTGVSQPQICDIVNFKNRKIS